MILKIAHVFFHDIININDLDLGNFLLDQKYNEFFSIHDVPYKPLYAAKP